MERLIIITGMVLLIAACGNSDLGKDKTAATSILQCGKDTDCKGDRICNAGQCVSSSALLATNSDPTTSTDPVPVCKVGDGLKQIPVWKPSIDSDGNLSDAPPGKDGQIVYIQLYEDASKTKCDDKELNAFSLPNDPKNSMTGGLAVNIRGNTQFANGSCYFQGYYMNEDVMGMHSGWIETYYGAVDKKEIIMSGKYCLAESIN